MSGTAPETPSNGWRADVLDEEMVEDAIAEVPAPREEDDAFMEEVVPFGFPEPAELLDGLTPEALEEDLEGIGPPPEETLHEVDRLSGALLDEGDTFEGLEADTVEVAIDEAAEPAEFSGPGS